MDRLPGGLVFVSPGAAWWRGCFEVPGCSKPNPSHPQVSLSLCASKRVTGRSVHNGQAPQAWLLMADHDGRKLSVRGMINAHLFPLLALVATASSVSIALSLGPIAGQSYRWNKCYDAGLAWLERTSPSIKDGDRTAIAANFCNGGLPNKPAR